MSQDPRVIPAASLQYIIVPVEGRDDNGPLDPTIYPVEFAFLGQDETPDGDTTWHAGTWFTEEQPYLPDIHKAKILIGPGGAVELTAGSWSVWVKVTHTVEASVERANHILIV